MNSRERFLAILLVLAIVGIGSVAAGYVLVWDPLKQSTDQLAKLNDEVKDLGGKRDVLLMQQFEYENKMRKMSLPLDKDNQLSQREYAVLLDRMLRNAKLDVQKLQGKPPNNKSNVPMLPGKKPIYTMLDFDVQVNGELQGFVSFLYNFYRQPLLHQIKKMGILKPSASRGGESKGGRELNFTLSIQALVLDRAEDRATLLATVPSIAGLAGGGGATAFSFRSVEMGSGSPTFTAPEALARGRDVYVASAQKEYSRIAGKNIFFDPPKTSAGTKGGGDDEDPESPTGVLRAKDVDSAPYLQLKGVSHCNGVSKALIYDRIYNEDYIIEMTSKGEVAVSHFWFKHEKDPDGLTIETYKTLHSQRKYLEFGRENSPYIRRYVVRRIMENELILEVFDPNRDKQIKADALVLGAAGASLIMPSKVQVWQVGHFLTFIDPKRASPGEMANANTDRRHASTELTNPKAIREVMTRAVAVDNEGDGIISTPFFEGEVPTDPKKTDGKKTDPKKGGKGGKGRP